MPKKIYIGMVFKKIALFTPEIFQAKEIYGKEIVLNNNFNEYAYDPFVTNKLVKLLIIKCRAHAFV